MHRGVFYQFPFQWIYYSRVPNRSPCAFISGKVCILGSIKVRRQTLPEINAHGLLFGTLEYYAKGQIKP